MVAHSKLHASEHAVSGTDDVHSYITHNSIQGLTTGDAHTQYVKKDGRTTGQTIYGGTGASENLTLYSTSHATKGKVYIMDELDMNLKQISNVGNVDGVDVSAHAAGTARSQHAAGMGDHTHESSGAEGGKLDHGLALSGLGDDDHTQYLLANGTRTLSADWNVGNHKLTSVANPVAAQDAATKSYVDGLVQGVDWQESVKNKTATEPATPSSGDRYLVEAAGFDTITAVDQPGKIFKHTGDVSTHYVAGDVFKVMGSTGNDGYYTVVSCVFIGGITEITVLESIPSAVADGTMNYTAVGASATWKAAGPDAIVTFNGTTWDNVHPNDGTAVWEEDDDRLWVYNGTDWVQFGSTIDHGTLTGLGDDDHTQYLLVNGSRSMSGGLNMGNNSITNANNGSFSGNITVDGTVDGVDISTHTHGGVNQGGTVDHASLSNQLGGGSYHLSQMQYNGLTSGGDIGTTYHNHDAIYYRESEFVDSDTDAVAPVKTKSSGHLDDSLIKEICVVTGAEPAVPAGEVRIWAESGASIWLIYGTDGTVGGNRRVQLT